MPNPEPRIAPDWYHAAFDDLYPIVYAHRSVEAAAEDVRFAIDALQITPADRVLDLCCGNGRHMVHLLRHCPLAVGLDYSAPLLKLAREMLGSRSPLVRADMRELPFCEVFDVVLNFFTSFGYFVSDEENLAAVRCLASALKPGGRFLIDYVNRAYAENNLEPKTSRRQNGYDITEERWIDHRAHRMNKTTVVSKSGSIVSDFAESVRLYSDDEFKALLREGSLRVERIFGDFTGGDCCDPSQPRMIAVGRKG